MQAVSDSLGSWIGNAGDWILGGACRLSGVASVKRMVDGLLPSELIIDRVAFPSLFYDVLERARSFKTPNPM